MIIFFSLLVCIIGMVGFLATKNNADLKELYRIAFAFGLLAFLLDSVPKLVTFITR
jgi:hypothetical protein